MRALKAPSWTARRCLTAFATLLSLTSTISACGEGRDAGSSHSSDTAAAASPAMSSTASALAVTSTVGRPAFNAPREIAADPSRAGGGIGPVMASPPPRPSSAPSVAPQFGPQGPVAPAAMVIRNGFASVQVDSLETAIASLQRTVQALGGYVGNTTMILGENQTRNATIELKIPSIRYEAAIAGLSPLGKVESVQSGAQDVGEEFVDLTARIANAKRLEARLVVLMENRTGRLQDALAVERELSRVREEIERIDGRARYLSARVAMSTLVVTLHEPAPLVATPGEHILLDAAKDAWRNFVRFIAVLISSLGVLVPIGVLAALALAAWKRWHRAATPVRLGSSATSDAS